MTTGENPEIGATADANGIKTNYLEAGKVLQSLFFGL